MKVVFIAAFAFSLSGCAGFTAYVQQHAATIGAVGMVAGAVAASESAVVNGIAIKNELEK